MNDFIIAVMVLIDKKMFKIRKFSINLFIIYLFFCRYETQHGIIGSIGYVAAECMSGPPSVCRFIYFCFISVRHFSVEKY